MRKMVVRSIVGLIMLGFFGVMVNIDHIYFEMLIIIGQIITWREVVSIRYNDIKEMKLRLFRTLNWYWIFVAFYFFYAKQLLVLAKNAATFKPHLATINIMLDYNPLICFVLYLIALVTFVFVLESDTLKYQIQQLAWTVCCLLLVVGQSHFAIANLYEGFIWLILPHGMIMVNDIMAYYCGMLMGRRLINRPLTHLSPNKTWEGFFGAMICTVSFAFYFSPYLIKNDWFICPADALSTGATCQHLPDFDLQQFTIPSSVLTWFANYGVKLPAIVELYPFQLHALVFAFFASLVAPFGGFLASGIKRAYQVKDYAALFPGHGGFMDRVDCQFMMASFVYVYYITIVKPYYLTNVSSVLSQVATLSAEDQAKVLHVLSKSLAQSAA